jgi:phage terminase large subunit
MGLEGFYEILQTSIRAINGTEFSFAGIRQNVGNIKSYEGVDKVWIEEAQSVSKNSWDVLIPTIRKKDSEIWITLNAELDTDETYKRFILRPPANAHVIKINWNENPWFPQVLREEMEELKRKDYDAYLNVWEGHCRQMLEGAIYAKEIRQATEEGRITRVPYDNSKPVNTFWDLGWSDHTSIWFAQAIGFEYRIIDFIQARQNTVNDFVRVLQSKPYVYGDDFLPHDAKSKTFGSNGRSVEELLRAAGRKVRIVPLLPKDQGINAARTIFSNCWFDATRCADGIQALRHYRYEVDPDTKQFSKTPLHDQYSDAADAFRYLALSLTEKKNKPKIDLSPNPIYGNVGGAAWMGR